MRAATKEHCMPNDTSRRNFLGLSALGIAAGVVANESGALAANPTSPLNPGTQEDPSPRNGSEIAIHVTSPDQRYAAAPAVAWSKSSAPRSATQIQLNPATKFQSIQGFGGALTDATCYMFNQLSASARAQLFHEMFGPSEMNLNLCRTCIGASDYSTKLYSYDDGESDPDLTRFSIEHDRAWILPMIREARQVNPDLFLFSTPWSPPGWMKFNNSMLGGSMRRFYLHAYAQYFLKFLQGYAAEGVTIQAVTSQNELDTDQDGRMPACIWPQEYEIQFIRDHLGPLLESTGTPVKIWLLDHNYNLWGRVVDCLEDEKLRRYSNSVAWHGYYGTPDMMSKAHEHFPDADMHWTEGGPDYTDADYLNGWCKWGRIFTDVLRNWCGSITTWNLALDEVGKPNLGPFPCGGVVSIHSGTQEITRSAQFWGLAHFSRTIRRGAHRFDSQSAATDVLHVAFENPDGSKVLVLTNKAAATAVALRQGKMNAAVPLKENSVTTLTWS
jgi:glucosylceramidase